MRVLVTGAAGFVGRCAVLDLAAAGHEVIPLTHAEGDLSAPGVARRVVETYRPEACLHLAGIAFVPLAWSDPDRVFRVNVGGTIQLLDAFRDTQPQARILICTSAQVYGNAARSRPIREDDAAMPDNLYGVSKLAADSIALLYARRYGMPVMTARPCNHTGPGQSPDFVLPSFARQVRAIREGRQPPEMRVGNLESLREFADVRDIVCAYRLLLERGQSGLAYNVATSRLCRIGDLLLQLCETAGITPKITVDPALYRPTDAQPAIDWDRLHQQTGWVPARSMAVTLKDLLDSA